VLGSNVRGQPLQILASLNERMSHGHQHRINSFDGPAHPGFLL
jgi:hypothetical protein